MDTPFERWQPDLDPIHRFIHLFDAIAGMVACHRWRPVEMERPANDGPPGECPPLDPAVHPAAIESAEHAAALADAAVAAYARLGHKDAEPVVAHAAQLKAAFAEAYRLHPCPCQLCPDCGKRPRSHPCEYILCIDYLTVRRELLRHLALGGHAVPRHVRMRGVRLAQLLRAEDPPPGPHAALRLTMAEILCWLGPAGGLKERSVALWRWVDQLAGPVGTAVRAGWVIRKSPTPTAGATESFHVSGGDEDSTAASEPTSEAVAESPTGGGFGRPSDGPSNGRTTPCKLRPAHRAILAAMRRTDRPLTGKALASASGYKPGTLRRHTKPLQDAGLIRRTPDGYELTLAGVSLIDGVTAHAPVI